VRAACQAIDRAVPPSEDAAPPRDVATLQRGPGSR
jgi:hypothetical protein